MWAKAHSSRPFSLANLMMDLQCGGVHEFVGAHYFLLLRPHRGGVSEN
jgi:hypothetical protein